MGGDCLQLHQIYNILLILDKRMRIFICLFLFLFDLPIKGELPSTPVAIEYDELNRKYSGADYMTGDWNGRRTTLFEEGITFASSYVNDILGNVSGGEARGVAEAGSFGIVMNVDLGKCSHFEGLRLAVSATFREGSNLSSKKIGNEFVSSGFDGNPAAIFYNTPFTDDPIATWGFVLQYKFWKRIVAKIGIYNANEDVEKNRYHGFNWSFHSTDGALFIGELAVQINQTTGDSGYPGNYRVGAYYFTGTEKEKFLGGMAHGNYGYYILLDQMIIRHGEMGSDRGLIPFIALLFAPEDRNIMPFFLSSGLVYVGPFSARPDDSMNLGFAYGKYSPNMRKAQQQAKNFRLLGPFGNRPQNFEALIEFNYWFKVNPWFTITPDIQYIINPSGFGTIPNALVIGVQVGFIF